MHWFHFSSLVILVCDNSLRVRRRKDEVKKITVVIFLVFLLTFSELSLAKKNITRVMRLWMVVLAQYKCAQVTDVTSAKTQRTKDEDGVLRDETNKGIVVGVRAVGANRK